MAQDDNLGRLVKDPEALGAFLGSALRGEVSRRVVMIVGNRIVGDSRVLKSAVTLAENGFEVLLVGTRPLPDDFSLGFIEGVPYLLVNSSELKTGADAEGHAEAMLAIGQRLVRGLASTTFSILYTHDFWGLDHGLRVMQAFAYRQPLYWTHDVHEYIQGYAGILPAGRLEYAISAEASYLGLPDQLVFVNERIADLLCAELPLQAQQRLIVHNAPRTQVTSPFQLRRKIGLGAEVPLGVYLGRATKARGLDVLIPALQRLPKLHFALLSSAARDYLAELRKLAETAGVAKRLHIFPYVPDTEVASAVADATFGISPLTRYGNSDLAVPTKVLEFIHAGLPMVVSDATFQADFVREHGLGEVFSSQDPGSFVTAVEKILGGGYRPDWSALREEYAWSQQFGRVVQHIENQARSGRVPLRGVFQGPAPSAGQPGILARGLRRIGVAAQSVNLSVNRGFAFRSDVIWPAPAIGYAQPSLAVWAARRFELFHLHFRPIISQFSGDRYEPTSFQDLALIRQHGRRIVFQFRGSEIRINDVYRAVNPFAWLEEDDPSKMPDTLKRNLLDVVRESADLILVPDPELGTYVPEARVLQRAVELEGLPYSGPKRRERPRVCHAPTRRGAKGTDAVLAAVETLTKEGLPFDFVLLEGLPHGALMKELAEADVVIDQIVIGWYGVLAVEAMALGKAVIAYIRDDLVNDVPKGVLVNASPKTITERLREVVSNADMRAELGRTARRFVEDYHASEVVAAKLVSIYDEVKQAPARDASIKMFASSFDNTLKLMAHDKRVADAKAKAKADAKAVAVAAAATPAKAPVKAPPGTSKVIAPRTIWQRISQASLAKAIHRVKRITGNA
jgi:glycosyltransferase involved in cell wall biosynthesis